MVAPQGRQLRPVTLDGYRHQLRLYILPHLGHVPLRSLRVEQIEDLHEQLLTAGRTYGIGGLSTKSVLEVHVLLRQILDDAVTCGLLGIKPARQAVPPRHRRDQHRHTPLRTRRAAMAWYRPRTPAPLDHTNDRVHQRPHAALQRQDVNAARIIDLNERTVAVLARWQQDHTDRLGGLNPERGLVLRDDGELINPQTISQGFERAVAKTELPRLSLHGLQHTHASLLLRAGVPPKVVSERLGHSTPAFTMATYQHVLLGMQAEAAATFASFMDETEE